MWSAKKCRKFRTKGVYGCIGVILLLLASKIHKLQNSANYKKQLNLGEICNKLDMNTEERMLSGYLVRRGSHLLYFCDVPKCGSTFTISFLKSAFTCDDCYLKRVRMAYSRKLYDYAKEMIQKSTYSFMFVREPYARLYAAFLNKLYCPNEVWQKLGTDVVKAVRRNASALSKHNGHDVTFQELVEYIIDSVKQRKELNIHLAPIHTRCNPCQMEFNFIGKLDSMTSNLMYLVDEWKSNGINIDLKQDINLKELELKNRRDLGPVEHLYTILARSPELPRYEMFQRLWSSYQTRGLILNSQTMPFNEDIVDNIDRVMYELAVEGAMESSIGNSTALSQQREDAIVKAYRSLPIEHLYQLRKVYKLDFALFNYEDMPSKYFAGRSRSMLRLYNTA